MESPCMVYTNIFIPFHLYSCISYFITRLPTTSEEHTCRWVVFTLDVEWEPYSEHFKESEIGMVNHHSDPNPCHLHFDQNGNRLDGCIIKSLNTVDVYASLDPSLSTFDFTYQNQHIGATSSKEHHSSVPDKISPFSTENNR
jgi:hypothetical protein